MLVCKMAGQRQETNSAQPSGSGCEPMEIGRLNKKLDQATVALNRLTTMTQQAGSTQTGLIQIPQEYLSGLILATQILVIRAMMRAGLIGQRTWI